MCYALRQTAAYKDGRYGKLVRGTAKVVSKTYPRLLLGMAETIDKKNSAGFPNGGSF